MSFRSKTAIAVSLPLFALMGSVSDAQSTHVTEATALCPLNGEAQREQMDIAIHDYLMRHPEVLVEMSQALRAKQQAAQAEKAKQALEANKDAVYHDATDPVVGNPSGTVTVVEFFDSQCPWCKRLAPDVERLVAENKDVRLVYKEFPILGPGSVIAAKAALASMNQGKYEAFHNALMADTTPEHQLAEPRVMEIANSVGLDVRRLKSDMAGPEIEAKVAANKALAGSLGITGTPGLIIDDQLMPGAMPYEALKRAVAEAQGRKTTANP